jgi:GNAT superfamily N-acetyltransferase
MNPPAECRIRRAAREDALAVAELATRTFVDAFGPDNRPADVRTHLARHCSPSALQRELADPAWTTLVAESDRGLEGYAQLRDAVPPVPAGAAPAVQLYRFYLERVRWGTGLAQRLMAAVLEDGRARGARCLWLTTWDRNGRALAFYLRSGFEVVGTTTFIVGEDPQRDLVLSRSLG